MRGRSRLAENPFYVLGLRPDCTRSEVERAGQKWLAMLDVGLSDAASYASPVGGMPRDADKVRMAMAELRDPEKRLVHELWATLDPDPEAVLEREAAAPPDENPAAWPDARGVFGWGRR